jgi:hypothetical protein
MRRTLITTAMLAAGALGALALGGCVSTQELAARDAAECTSYGATFGTQDYLMCRLLKDQQHRIERAEAIRDMGEDIGKIAHGLQGY